MFCSHKIDFTTLAFGNYSTSEVDTGFTYIDGKPIFKKTVQTNIAAGGTSFQVYSGILYMYRIAQSFSSQAILTFYYTKVV